MLVTRVAQRLSSTAVFEAMIRPTPALAASLLLSATAALAVLTALPALAEAPAAPATEGMSESGFFKESFLGSTK